MSMQLKVGLGPSTRSPRDVLSLAPGEVAVLGRRARAAVELYVDGGLFARGQVAEATKLAERASRFSEILTGGAATN